MAGAEKYDLVIIGAGPGGYVAAIRAGQLGLKTALVEKEERLGGTCLNVGCIPSKALLDSSELFWALDKRFPIHGISVESAELDLGTCMKRKAAVVNRLTDGIANLVSANGVKRIRGRAHVRKSGFVTVEAASSNSDKPRELETERILLATGSVPAELPYLPFDGRKIVSSTEALSFETVPESLLVVGAGAIGLELGSVWSKFGSKIEVIEIMPEVLPGWDRGLARGLRKSLEKQGMEFFLKTKVTSAGEAGQGIELKAEDGDGKEVRFSGEKVLVAVGRKPCYEGIDIEAMGIKTDEAGRLLVGKDYQTSRETVYAIGDIVGGPMLAHKAEDEAMAAVERMTGIAGEVNYSTIPSVVYTHPEAASVGKTEEELDGEGRAYRKGRFPFRANGRALALEEPEGSVVLLADEASDRVLGAHILGPHASDLLAEIIAVMEFGGSAEDIARTVHAHPTLGEAVREAALGVDRRAIHIINKKR